ncbi:uncharacterized protein LOC114952938 [Acropora millepora]|uniref:uncharacterized protein LOC114952938 n=1 Tax=Acropora millepora TaxID=45264 RepID=UPI001CF3686D|nr:uncharacterized protein LOC114952938 [Acropora millepora]
MQILFTPQRLVPTLLIFLLLHKNPRNTTILLAGAEVRSFTSYNNVLAGFVYQATEMLDWLECIQACQQDVRCISYNFWSSFGTKCELNSCGFVDECSAEKMLIWFRGGIFQQVSKLKDDKSICDHKLTVPASKTEVTQASFSCYQSMVIYADGKRAIKNEIVPFGEITCSDILPINFTIPRASKVVAIMAQASQGTAKIIGSFADGVVTDSKWKCSSKNMMGWTLSQFNDSLWLPANEIPATDLQATTDTQISGILSSAKWIRTKDLGQILFCRLHRKMK